MFVDRKLGGGSVAGVAALFVAFTRVDIGVHYPGDVLADLVLGCAVAYACYRVLVPLLNRTATPLAATKAGWLVEARRNEVTRVPVDA